MRLSEFAARAAEQWLAGFARASENAETLDTLVKVVDDRIIESLPAFLDPHLRAELHASTRSHWKGFLAVVTRESTGFQSTPQVQDLARTLARRGFELPYLLSVYRIGRRAVWHYITDVLQAEVPDPAVKSAVLLRFWSHVAYWLDTAVESLIVTFSLEREQWQRGRTSIVNAIVAGDSVDVDSAILALAYPLRSHHTAFTLRVDDKAPDIEVAPLIESAARTVATGIGGGRPLVVASTARAAWCWTATTGPAAPTTAGLSTQLPHLVTATLGTCHPALDGFRLTHLEAIAALSVSGSTQGNLVAYADVEIACLAAGLVGRESRAAFVRRELRELADDDDVAARLRETLQTYLKHAGNATTTGELLNLHPNSVRYRIRQAEKLLGHSIQTRRVQTELALELTHVLGLTQ